MGLTISSGIYSIMGTLIERGGGNNWMVWNYGHAAAVSATNGYSIELIYSCIYLSLLSRNGKHYVIGLLDIRSRGAVIGQYSGGNGLTMDLWLYVFGIRDLHRFLVMALAVDLKFFLSIFLGQLVTVMMAEVMVFWYMLDFNSYRRDNSRNRLTVKFLLPRLRWFLTMVLETILVLPGDLLEGNNDRARRRFQLARTRFLVEWWRW